MSAPLAARRGEHGRFRIKLLASMMALVLAITTVALLVAQRQVAAGVERDFRAGFDAQLAALHARQEARLAAIAQRCRELAGKPRIHAALEDNALDLLYPSAREELRDLMAESADGPAEVAPTAATPDHPRRSSPLAPPAAGLRALFYRFLDENGAVIPPPASGGGLPVAGASTLTEAALALPGGLDRQQLGYFVDGAGGDHRRVEEVIATPIVSAENHEPIGALVMGFPTLITEEKNTTLESGLWLEGKLCAQALNTTGMEAVGAELAGTLARSSAPESRVEFTLGGVPHLLFYKLLNPGSRFPPAYEASWYSLADSLARQRQLRWEILGAGGLLLLAGWGASHLVSTRFSAPVAELEVVSTQHAAHRERAEAALETANVELRARNAELQAALANLQSAQQHLIQQERLGALGQMASGIAHDFNNALVPILGFCELLLLSPVILADKKKSISYLETIQTAAKDAASVVSRLREFYRPDKNDRAFTPVNLKRLVEQSVTLTKPKWKDQAQARGATVQIALELEPVPPISGEESALREVLTNLIFNAVDAMPDGGTLTLRTHQQRDIAVLEIGDTGTGMTEEVRQRCLEPFFSTKGERGTGLGLSMVFGIVQRHSGALEIESTPGQGTKFIITFSLQDAAPAASAAPATSPIRPLRILVVDDEAPVRDTLAAVLAADGHEVAAAESGADGLRRFARAAFDLVITDKAMPGMNGEQMAAAIKQVSPNTPIVLLTGFGLFHDKEEFPEVDVLATKPIRIPALRDAIAQALRATAAGVASVP